MDALFSRLTKSEQKVEEADLAGLPDCVQQWLRRAGEVGRPVTQNVRVLQTAAMRLSEAGVWMSVEADQVFRVQEPGIIWLATIQAAPGCTFPVGTDAWTDWDIC